MKRLPWVTLIALAVLSPPLFGQPPGRGPWRLPGRRGEPDAIPLAWGPRAAAHLMRRAGFSASPKEVRRIVEQGFDQTLQELLHPEMVDDSAAEADLRGRGYALVQPAREMGFYYGNLLNMERVWLHRMIHSRRQLLEKMTFFWHDHFSTSFEGVPFATPERGPLLQIQNETLRAHALGNFRVMLHAVARDPAMVIWLNNFENRVGAPNENWARELMELFTLGEGNGYTEQDVQEAARAFTGWSLEAGFQFQFYTFFHDFGDKTVLGRTVRHLPGETGVEEGDRVIDILLERPAAAEFVTRKLWEFFVYPNPPDSVVRPLAQLFRRSDYDIRTIMEAIFRHPHFLSKRAYRAKVKTPVEFAVQACRELEISDPVNLPALLFFFPLGQQLFLPPDVGGWPADAAWINTGAMLGRYNFLTILTSKRQDLDFGLPGDDFVPVQRVAQENELFLGADFVEYYLGAMLQGDVSLDTRHSLEDYLDAGDFGAVHPFDASEPGAIDKKVRGLIQLVSFLPVYQLN